MLACAPAFVSAHGPALWTSQSRARPGEEKLLEYRLWGGDGGEHRGQGQARRGGGGERASEVCVWGEGQLGPLGHTQEPANMNTHTGPRLPSGSRKHLKIPTHQDALPCATSCGRNISTSSLAPDGVLWLNRVPLVLMLRSQGPVSQNETIWGWGLRGGDGVKVRL